jgi:hypothetical protein
MVGLILLLGGAILLLEFVFPLLSSTDMPLTDPVALFSYFIAGTGYVASGRGGRNLQTASGIMVVISLLIFIASSFSGAHAYSLELQNPNGPVFSGFRPYHANSNNSHGLQDILLLESTVFMVSQSPDLQARMA